MNRSRLIAAAFAALIATSGMTARGFLPSQRALEERYESVVAASPSEKQATADELGLASYVHRMGTPGDYRSAQYMQHQLSAAGWDAQIVTYVVPMAWPTYHKLTLLGAHPHDIDLFEPAVAGDSYSQNHAAIGVPYSGYSVDGDVTGPIVYANHASPSDFDALAAMGVSVRGAIVVARAGGGALTAKAFEGARRGAKAVLVFPDPLEGGYFKGETYPNGPWRPLGGAMRNTMTFTNDPGDPTAIGIPVPGAPHKPFSAIKLPSIPEAPITGLVARALLEAMGGAVAPPAWHPGFAFAQHVGGNVRAHFVLRSKRFFGPMWDVIATMPGVDTNQMVVVGSHRDAWTYGAVDPISGSVDLLQLGRAMGRIKAMGWKPQRTIVIGSWDGEELNLFGSDIWVRQHEAALRAGAVAYINTDEVAFGPTFGAAATPELQGLIDDATTAVTAPNGQQLSSFWQHQDATMQIGAMGTGSDHEPFVYRENIPAAAAIYYGPFGTYHSAYDDPASLRILDPGMHEAAAAARMTSMMVLRLADASYPDLRLKALADALQARLNAFAKGTNDSTQRASVVATLAPDLTAFASAAQALDARADDAIARGDAATLAATYAQLRASESAFFQPQATTWIRSLLYAEDDDSGVLPTLDDTLDPTGGSAALATLQRAIEVATAATRTPTR